MRDHPEPLDGVKVRRVRQAMWMVWLMLLASAGAQMQVERLNRGVIALRSSSSQIYVGWRYLGTDPDAMGFYLERSVNGGAWVRLTPNPLTLTTDYRDSPGANALAGEIRYRVIEWMDGVEGAASESNPIPAGAPVRGYLTIPIQPPPNGTTPAGESYTYSANDAAPADLDGDGTLDLVLKWEPSNAKDNAQSGYTGEVYLDGYRLDGTRLWRINLGRNIRAGAHYTQFIAYDLDSDGRAEVAMKTAPGTLDGLGNAVLMPGDQAAVDYRNSSGYILTGPEYLTVFDGLTGAALATTAYVPGRGTVSNWGDSYGNRVDRFVAGVAYLDGKRPSLVMCRGYYTQTHLVAWDWRNRELTQRWGFQAPNGSAYAGQGNHQLSVADVDGDGKQEIVYGSMTVDDQGQGLYSTGLGHGDALHVSDFDPFHPGLEVFAVHEDMGSSGNRGSTFRDAATGAILWSTPATGDTGRGCMMDIDPEYPGAEAWNSSDANLYGANGTVVAGKPSNMHQNFGVWWDADVLRETLDGTVISDWNTITKGRSNLLQAWEFGAVANNGSKSTPCLSGDFLGDWREEVVWRNADSSALLVFSPTTSSTRRLRTFLHDPQYRCALAWQNCGYNQPPHPSFFVGQGMVTPPVPAITTEVIPLPRLPGEVLWKGAVSQSWNLSDANFVLPSGGDSIAYLNGDRVRFEDSGPLGTMDLAQALSPAEVLANHHGALSFQGNGYLTGSGSLKKSGSGVLTIATANAHQGGTVLEGGTLVAAHALAFGSGNITLRGGLLQTGGLTISNAILVEADASVAGGHPGGAHGVKVIRGNRDLSLIATDVFDLEGSLSGFSGRLWFGGSGTFRLFGSMGSSAAAFHLQTSQLSARSGTSFALGALHGLSGSRLSGSSGSGNTLAVTYTIGGRGEDCTFGGVIANGNGTTSIQKVGSGKLHLLGANSYTGNTQVQEGSLIVMGSLASGTVFVSPGATLAGSGTLSGNVSLASGARLGLMAAGNATSGLQLQGSLSASGPVQVSAETATGILVPGTYRVLSFQGNAPSLAQWSWVPPSGTSLSGQLVAGANQVNLILTEPPPSFANWLAKRYGVNAEVGNPLADPDGNGVCDLLEYALGNEGHQPFALERMPKPIWSGGRLAIRFQRIADPELKYVVEAGDDMESMGSIWSSTGAQNQTGWVEVSDLVPASQAKRRLMRLRVTGAN